MNLILKIAGGVVLGFLALGVLGAIAFAVLDDDDTPEASTPAAEDTRAEAADDAYERQQSSAATSEADFVAALPDADGSLHRRLQLYTDGAVTLGRSTCDDPNAVTRLSAMDTPVGPLFYNDQAAQFASVAGIYLCGK